MTFFKKRISAFYAAFNGLFNALKNETHVKIHFVASLIVLIAGFYFQLSKNDWLWIILCCALVIAAELINSAIENICDLIDKNYNQKIKYIKDVSAASVLVLSFFSIIVAFMVFKKYF
jgi:diacylglycerol kinase